MVVRNLWKEWHPQQIAWLPTIWLIRNALPHHARPIPRQQLELLLWLGQLYRGCRRLFFPSVWSCMGWYRWPWPREKFDDERLCHNVSRNRTPVWTQALHILRVPNERYQQRWGATQWWYQDFVLRMLKETKAELKVWLSREILAPCWSLWWTGFWRGSRCLS